MKSRVVLIVSILMISWADQVKGSCSPCRCFKKSLSYLRDAIYVADCHKRHLNKVPSGLPQNIESLDISGNQLSQIAVEDLQYPELRILSLAQNNLSSLPPDLFLNVSALEQLDMSGNRIVRIPWELFVNTPAIRKVIGLHTVTTPLMLFEPASRMKNLSFVAEDNVISMELFQAISLSDLDVSFTNVHGLPPYLLSAGSYTLRRIRLTGKKLTSLHQSLFANLTQVELIHLTVDGIKELPLHIFHGTHEQLDLQLVELKNIQKKYRDIVINSIMTRLQTTNARLKEIMVDGVNHIDSHLFQYLVNLETLIIRRAKSVDPKTFQGLSRLDRLELTHMNLLTIDSGWFHDLAGLKCLTLSHNSLSSIHNVGFSHLHSLDTLDLSDNNFTVINSKDLNSFRNYLKLLDLSFNAIEHLPAGILADTYALKEVRLQGNGLKELSEQHFTGLDDADIGNYDYQMTLSQKELSYFDISNNSLEAIHLEPFLQMGSIEVLNIANNNIENVTTGMFPKQINIGSTILTNNPVSCSCEFVSFVELSKWAKREVLGRCQEPANLRGIPFMEVTIPEECFETVKELLEAMTTDEVYTTEAITDVTTENVWTTLEPEVTTEGDDLDTTSLHFESYDDIDSQINIQDTANSTVMGTITVVEFQAELTQMDVTKEYDDDEELITTTVGIRIGQDLGSGDTSGKYLSDVDQSGDDESGSGIMDISEDQVTVASGEDVDEVDYEDGFEVKDDILLHKVYSGQTNRQDVWKWVGVGVGAFCGAASVPAIALFVVKMRGYLYKMNYFTHEKKKNNIV